MRAVSAIRVRSAWLTPAALLVSAASAVPSAAQAPTQRKIAELELALRGVQATLDPAEPVVPKNVASGVRVVVRAGAVELTPEEVARFLGSGYRVEGELSGPGLPGALTLPRPEDPAPADPLLLPLPALPAGGDYLLANARIVGLGGETLLDVTPARTAVRVVDQILVTSVKTRPLTLDEIRAKGIVLDGDDYLGFEFSLGIRLESNPVNLTFPVVFDREGVVVPQPLVPPPPPPRGQVMPPSMIVPMLLDLDVPPDFPGGSGVNPGRATAGAVGRGAESSASHSSEPPGRWRRSQALERRSRLRQGARYPLGRHCERRRGCVLLR